MKIVRVDTEVDDITYGSVEPTKLWIFPVPRIGLSWRFGQDVTGIRFILTYSY